MKKSIEYIENNKQKFLDELFVVMRIPSISAISSHKQDMHKCAEQLAKELINAGADKAEVMPSSGNPIVYAQKIVDTNLPTILVYGHYDVMPAEPIEAWQSPPFDPEVRDGHIWGRGADDDKGQSFMHIKALEAMVQSNELPCNIKFMLEGEEEIGSPSLEEWCQTNKELLKADLILVSDTSLIGWEIPSITCGLRGISYMEVSVTGPSRDLHSGLYGGAVANPANVLSKMIASLTDDNGKVTIPGFYDNVQELSAPERALIQSVPFNEEKYKQELHVGDLSGEEGYCTPERTGIRPALDVNGIWSGHITEGTKTIIPSKASAKISMRLVANQDYKKIAQLFEDHFKAIAPKTVKVDVQFLHGGPAYHMPTTQPEFLAASKAIEKTFSKEAVPFYSGGSIPIISCFERVLGIKSLLLGFGLSSDAIHSPNENFPLRNFYRGMETIVWFYHYYCNKLK